jgi:hypothetical protein
MHSTLLTCRAGSHLLRCSAVQHRLEVHTCAALNCTCSCLTAESATQPVNYANSHTHGQHTHTLSFPATPRHCMSFLVKQLLWPPRGGHLLHHTCSHA